MVIQRCLDVQISCTHRKDIVLAYIDGTRYGVGHYAARRESFISGQHQLGLHLVGREAGLGLKQVSNGTADDRCCHTRSAQGEVRGRASGCAGVFVI